MIKIKTSVFKKNSQNQICRFFWGEQFYSLTFFCISHSLAGKWIFWFYKKPFLINKTRTVGQKWLANELDLHFLTLKKFTKGQSNRSILSKVIVLRNYKSIDRHTETQTDRHIRENHFFGFRGYQNVDIWTFDKNGRGHILHKSNTFSDENVKN